jgi:hypothetical protein
MQRLWRKGRRGLLVGAILGLLGPGLWLTHYEWSTPEIYPYTMGYQYLGAFVMTWFTLPISVLFGSLASAYGRSESMPGWVQWLGITCVASSGVGIGMLLFFHW